MILRGKSKDHKISERTPSQCGASGRLTERAGSPRGLMAPPRKITREQLEILLDFMESNKDLISRPTKFSPHSSRISHQKWSAIAKKLNSVKSGTIKSAEKWRRYWTEWSSKCRKKAKRTQFWKANLNNSETPCVVTLNNLEIRLLELTAKKSDGISNAVTSSIQDDNDNTELNYENVYSDTEIVINNEDDMDHLKYSSIDSSKSLDDNALPERGTLAGESKYNIELSRDNTPPPQWALELEERRISSQEKMADALQSIASTLRNQEERRVALDQKLTNTLSALAQNIQGLSNGLQEVIHHISSDKEVLKEVVYIR
ncbi:unnamed protein product [Leptosia nina]|uniref:Regulatory protein zeste n=1 Tax=Leptosia nina TaxID=320188 RepID=A0AAV1JN49_9NEOP